MTNAVPVLAKEESTAGEQAVQYLEADPVMHTWGGPRSGNAVREWARRHETPGDLPEADAGREDPAVILQHHHPNHLACEKPVSWPRIMWGGLPSTAGSAACDVSGARPAAGAAGPRG